MELIIAGSIIAPYEEPFTANQAYKEAMEDLDDMLEEAREQHSIDQLLGLDEPRRKDH